MVDAEFAQPGDRPLRLGTDCVGDGDDALQVVLGADQDDGLPLGLELGNRLVDEVEIGAVLAGLRVGGVAVGTRNHPTAVGFDVRVVQFEAEIREETGLAGVVGRPVEVGLHALARDGLEVRDLSVRDAVVLGVVDDGRRDGMFAPLFERAGTTQQLRVGRPVERDDVRDRQLARRERAGLVEGDGVDAAHRFEMVAALDQDAVARGRGDARDDRDGRRDDERTGASDDEERQPPDERLGPRHAEDDRRDQDRRNRERDDDRRVVAREAVDELLGLRSVGLGVLDHRDDLRERRILGRTRHLDFEVAALDDAAGVDLVARGLVGGDALAGDGRLVDRAASLPDDAVDGDLVAGTDHDRLADGDVLDGDGRLLTVAEDGRGVRRQLHQFAHRVPRAVHRVAFEQLGDAEEDGQRRRLERQIDDQRADDARRHQEVDVEVAVHRGVVAVADDGLPGDEHRTEIERPRDGDLAAERAHERHVQRDEEIFDDDTEDEEGRTGPRLQAARTAPDAFCLLFLVVGDSVARTLDGGDDRPARGASGVVGDEHATRRRLCLVLQHAVEVAESVLDFARAGGTIHVGDAEGVRIRVLDGVARAFDPLADGVEGRHARIVADDERAGRRPRVDDGETVEVGQGVLDLPRTGGAVHLRDGEAKFLAVGVGGCIDGDRRRLVVVVPVVVCLTPVAVVFVPGVIRGCPVVAATGLVRTRVSRIVAH